VLQALLVGADVHADPRIPPLRFARADVEALATLLHDRVEGECCVTVLADEEAVKHRIVTALTEDLPRRLSPGDTVLVYFAGHGSPEIASPTATPSLHLVLHDSEYERLAWTSINLDSELYSWIRRLEASVVTVVLDASFNGAPGGRSFEGPGLWSGPRTRRLDRVSLSRLVVGYPCCVIGACKDNEVAREEPAFGHGVLTHHLLQLLSGPTLSGAVSTPRLHRELADAVREGTRGAQTPIITGASVGLPLLRLRDRMSGAVART
jgi:uncharacterized caspase-like protein